MSAVKRPTLLWAQRSSSSIKQKNYIYLTVDLPGIVHSTVVYDITNTSFSLKANAKDEGEDDLEYTVAFDFHAKVEPPALVKQRTDHSVTFVIFKHDLTIRYWPRLSSNPELTNVKTDFSRWTWEGDESDAPEDENQRVDVIDKNCGVRSVDPTDTARPFPDSRWVAAPKGMFGDLFWPEKLKTHNKGPSSSMPSATPHLKWAQRSSATDKIKNIIWLTIMIPHILESTLTCKVTDTSISFNACGREGYDERRFVLELELYSDVEEVSRELSEQFFMIILHKRVMTARFWPRLQKDVRISPYIGADFRRWTWEGDDSEDVAVDEKTAIGYNGSISEKAEECEQLGIFFIKRFVRLQHHDDLNMAVSKFKEAVNLTSDWQLEKPERRNMLACTFAGRFEHWGNVEDLTAAIEILEDTLESVPSSQPLHLTLLNHLGHCFELLFERRGDHTYIDRSISLLRRVVDHTSADDSELSTRLNTLGLSLLRRFERFGDFADIDSSIYHHQLAVELVHEGHQNFSGCHHSLGISLLCRAKKNGNLDDIDLAIHHLTKAFESCIQLHRAVSLHSLGTSYMCRFEMKGDLADIDTAILHLQQSIFLSKIDDPLLPGHFINLGASLLCRFERTHVLADVDAAINHYTKAVELTPLGHPNLAGRYSNLGNSYRFRLGALGHREDADSSILNHQKAVELTPAGHAQLPTFLTNLGSSYIQRFELFKDGADADQAILYHRQAADLTSSPAQLPGRLNNLGGSYLSRFNFGDNIVDVDAAISLFQQALDVTPHGHVSLSERFYSLALCHQGRFQKTFDTTDITCALSCLCQGAEAPGPPSSRFSCASTAATLSQDIDPIPNPSMYLFGLAISLLSEIAGIEQTIHRRYANLQGSAGFVPRGVAAALDHGRPDLAIEWLELGRCLVWNQIDRLRTPIDQLRDKNPLLADKFTRIAKMLDTLGARSETNNPSSSMEDDIRIQDQTLLHTRTAESYKEVLQEIRSLSGFEDFLQPAKATSLLASLPPNGAVILFSIGTDRCNALALAGGLDQPLYVLLDNFNYELARSLQGTLQDDIHNHRMARDLNRGAIDHVDSSIVLTLEVLWHKVAKPILDALRYTIPLNRADRPRIWWCPSGPLSFLPLHAAGLYSSQNPTCVSDYVVSSYTPTVRSLIEKFQASKSPSSSRSKAGLLLISQPNTPGLPAIPSTIRETKSLKATMDRQGVRTLLLEHDEATREKVKEELNSYSWVHFACHGVQDAKKPLESGLCLHDGRLDLLEIMKERVQEPQLAFLSACQTSTGDFALSEEVVHLAAGMLAAGYRGVVGTMWSISDEHGPLFAEEFYRYLLGRMGPNGLDGSLAAYALDHATSVVRQKLGNSEHGLLK
ncbi:Protein wos2 [Psilocybe cubensis]|uniref:CS domain-containing protein n=2 Tax=Psilocybe cubensis TaxID=181762 RepID=A0A8H7Y457_PSICU|nr:Protein wos2 [Psilocybe cubensis]KAH9485864.1 Protein wos2 [Psilocybe cubensis]